jgi:hypothetical protein
MKKQNDENIDTFHQLIYAIFDLNPTSIRESFEKGEVTLGCACERGETTNIIITKSIDDDPLSLHVTLSGGNDAALLEGDIYIPILHDLLIRKGWLDDKLNRKMNWLTQGVLITDENIQQVLADKTPPACQWYEVE